MSRGLPREVVRQSIESTHQVSVELADVLEVLVLQGSDGEAQPAYDGPGRLRQREEPIGIYVSVPAELFILSQLKHRGVVALL